MRRLTIVLLLALAGCKSATAPPAYRNVAQVRANVPWTAAASVDLPNAYGLGSGSSALSEFSETGTGDRDFDMRVSSDDLEGCLEVDRADTLSTGYASVRIVVTNLNWRATAGLTGPDSATGWVAVPRAEFGITLAGVPGLLLGHGQVCSQPHM